MVNHSVAVGASYAIEDEILRAAEYIERTGMTEIREIDPSELGMDDEGALNKYLIEPRTDGRTPTICYSVVVCQPSPVWHSCLWIARRGIQNAPVLEKEDVLQINQMAMNNISGEGFNSKLLSFIQSSHAICWILHGLATCQDGMDS